MENLNLPKELEEKLAQAIKADKYFINITCDVGGPNNMQHFWITRNFPKDRIIPTLEYFKDDLTNKQLRDTQGGTKWE
jgi:hypothetical protein